MASGKETYYRKRGYSRVHVKTWTIHLEKDGFVPCSFQNCKFMAFNIVDIKNHYNTCKGEVFQAPYECGYCKGLTEHADKLEEHILRFHGHNTPTAESKNVHIDTKRSKEPDEELFSIINEKSEISKVIIYSWDVSKEIYGYIKCPDCSLISETVDEMKSHIFNCGKNPSAFAYECHKCNGKVTSQTSLNHHMVECHSDSVLDDTFIENYSNFWKEQIDSHGFARCSNRCKFVHIDCSKLKQHLKASCSKEAGCHPVMYCDNKSCSVWSTSNFALVKHQKFEHGGKTSGSKDAKCEMNTKEKIDKQICKNNSEGNLTSRISESFSPTKDVTMMDSQVEGKCIDTEKRTKCRENAPVGRSLLETKVPSSNPDALKNIHGLEADSNTKLSASLKSTNIILQHPKEVGEEILKNDDLYQLQTPSDANNEITIDDPLSCESEDQILFVKQNDYSRLEDGAFNKMKEEIASEEDDDDTNSIYSNTSASPGIKLIVEKTIKCYSRMAEISKQNHSKQEHVTNSMNEPNGENIKERIESQIKRYDKNGDSPINMFSSRQRTYSSTKNIGKYNKKYGSSTENEFKPKLCDSVMLVRKDSSTLGDKKNDDVSKVTEISSSVCSTPSLSATPNCDKTGENLVKNILEFKINTSKKLLYSYGKSNNTRNRNQLEVEDVCKDKLTEDASGGDESLNPQVDVSTPEENEPFNTCSHENVHSLNKNKRGRPKKISMDVEKDLVKNKSVTPQKRGRSERLRKMSSGLEPDLQGEVHNVSGKDIQEKSGLAGNERFKTVNSDLNDSVQTALVKNDHLDSSLQVQKQKEALKISGSSAEIASKSKDESPTIQKKRGRPRKIRSGISVDENSQEVKLSILHSQEIVQSSEEKSVDLIAQIETATSKEMAGELGDCLQPESCQLKSDNIQDGEPVVTSREQMKLSITQEETPDTQLNRKRRGRSRTISNNIGINLDEISTSNSGKIQQERETCEDKEEVHSEALKPSCPDPEEGFKTRNNEGSMNFAPKIIYEHGSPTQICSSTSHEHSANVESIPKKRGRPKKICLDSVELSEELVPNLTLQEKEEENFKDCIIEVGKTLQKSEEDEIDGGRLNENCSETKYNPIELENPSSLLENSNKISQMIEKRQRRSRKISLPPHEDSTLIPKKRGRPKKISLDSLSKSEKVVPTLNLQEENETFSNVVVEERKNVVECEPMKSEGLKTYKRRSIAKSSATKYHEIELGKTSASIENSDNNEKIIEKKQMGTKKMSFCREDPTSIPKKRGRPTKNSLDPTLSVQEEKQPESACSNINNDLDVIETTSTAQIVSPNIEVGARKKRGKTQKMCSRLEEEVSRGSEQEEIEKQIINNQEEVDTTIPERENVEHNTEIPEAVSSDHTQISEEITTASSFPNIQKKRGRSKRRKLGQDETLKSFDGASTQIENRKQSLDSTHQNSKMKDSTDYVENSFDEHPNIDSCEKSTTNVVEETSIPIAPMKRKPGRPRKSVPVPVLIQPNIDSESMANRDLDNSPKSNVSEPKKTADYFVEQSNLDDDESVPEIGSVSVISGKLDETPASSITDKNSKKKLVRHRKRSAINASENDQEIHTEENVPSKRKRTSSKPFKRSSYVLDKSDLDETLGNDGEENPSKTLKRRLGRGKKMSATALDFSVDAENFNTSLETKQNLCSTPRRPARSISKPKKYKGFVQESLIESRRSSSNSDDSAHDTQDKEWQLSDAVENVEIDPLDKNENHSPVESAKPSKAISGKKKNMPPRRAVQLIACAICKKSMTRSQFETHAAEHNYFCWIEGDTPYDFEKEDDIHRHFFVVRRFKSFKGFKCDKCGAVKKSSVGYLSHKSMCGASQVEKENLKVCCPVCKRFMLPSSLKVHMGTDHRPTTKLPIQQEAVVTGSSSKRAAATRAGLNFEDELDAMESEEAKEQLQLRKWYCSKKKDHTTLIGEELDLEINSELICREPTCSFKTDDLDTLQAHHATCSKLNRDYECKICGILLKELLDIKHHILTNHAQVIENDHSDFELGEESEHDEDFRHQENKNPSQPSLVHVRPRFVSDEAQRTGLNFIYRHMQRNHDRLQANFQDSSLYKEHLAVPNGFLSENDLLHYLPKTQESMRISTGTEHWEQLKLMECRTIEDSCCVFVGGPVWAMEWCPSSLGDDHQWLAVSCHPDMDAVYSMGDVHSHNNLIQIWDFGPLNLCSSVLPSPTLSIGIAHSQGTAWDVAWCPEGCHQPDSGRLGLLAVAFSSGIAHIYSVPLVTTHRGKPFYKLTPVVELTPPYDERVQCVRITWSSDSPFNVVAVGFIDGTIALYNITTSSILLRDGIKIHPYKVFTAHTESITGLQFIPNKTGNILMSSSLDKTLKFWNLLDTSAPISTCRKITPIRDALWLNNWLCAVSVNDDGYTNGMSHLHLNNFRDLFYLQTIPWIPVDNTQWSVTASEWSNSIAMGSETGEIRIIYPHQLFSIDKSTKRASVHATTRTTLKKLQSEGEQQEEEGELDTSGPSNYKDAAENYGLVFTENQGATENPVKEKSATKCLFPVKSINKISFNPNRQAFTYLAIGYQCGVVRVIRDKHFDYAKAEMKNFADSLLMR